MSVRLCVATFGEDISWVAETGFEACVYDATRSRAGLIPVKNEAREASQYIRHIVEHYGDFRDHEVFLQGSPKPHNSSILHAMSLRPWTGKRVHSLGRVTMSFDPNMALPHYEHTIPFAREIGLRMDELQPWTIGAMFAASREALMDRPREWWEMLLEKAVIECAWSPWVLERLWLSIIDPRRRVPSLTSL
ncbi:DUF3431 domain-containing protein [Luteolibacter yonseiensis]|uniref:DUF3431 domain-containing protein n=1 Tax=Luteolibacter yonseiensis TaxID=1144680 RepID=A0A934R5V4_9BACT|nr:DUF3431 domain-containing protein [Luteolibacter yonseiensis]MBK1816538.1 DUF3431 domain-containing protein [Luteolibacter yonseiensis]